VCVCEKEKERQETYGTAAAIAGRIRSRYRCGEIAGNRAGTTCAKYEYLQRRNHRHSSASPRVL